jgi:hypothetical protein
MSVDAKRSPSVCSDNRRIELFFFFFFGKEFVCNESQPGPYEEETKSFAPFRESKFIFSGYLARSIPENSKRYEGKFCGFTA